MTKKKFKHVVVVNGRRNTRREIEFARKPTTAQIDKISKQPGVKTVQPLKVPA